MRLRSPLIVCLLICACALAATAAQPTARMFDVYGSVCCEDEMARLDVFAIELQKDPDARAYVIYYGGRRHYPSCDKRRMMLPARGDAAARGGRLKPYLVNTRGMDAARVVVINGGYREEWSAELWVVPKGAAAPRPTPTVDHRKVRFRKGRVNWRHYRCDIG